jgi:Dyp-type peroxidase family
MVEPQLDVDEIQGHSLRGFDTLALVLLGLKIGDPSLARAWLSALSHRVDTLKGVHHYRVTRSFAPTRAPRTVLNIALSAHGLAQLGTDISVVEDGLFLQPMGLSAGALGDATDASAVPKEYLIGTTWDNTPDILLIIGGDSADAAKQFAASLRAAAAMADCSSIYEECGAKLPGETEHFGFRDGISQVGVRGRLSSEVDDYLTLRTLSPSDPLALVMAKPGQPLVWPGQFVFGYPTHLPGSPLDPGPDSDGGAPWMKNGSFLVFRRLRQNVSTFQNFLQAQAKTLTAALGRNISEHEIGSFIVGRWLDGSPAMLTPNQPDPALARDEMLVNNFAFAQGTPTMTVVSGTGQSRVIPAQPDDHLAQRCPYFAHIRKVNPRDLATDQGIAGRTLTFQMLRRGIPYGAPVSGQAADNADRGLLFLAYQTSFKRQFNVLNTLWVNNASAPELIDEGYDLLIGQNSGGDRIATLRDSSGAPKATLTARDRWVIPTGGGFFFAPSVPFLRSLN